MNAHSYPAPASPVGDDFGEDWFDQFRITPDRTEFECDGCPYHFPADELFDGGNGGFYCADCCRQDQWFSGDRPDLQTLADASLLGDR